MRKVPDISIFLIITAVWILCALVINPLKDFPLNDDWSYAYAVKTLVSDGDLEYRGWMSMTLFAQVLWGSAFAKLFGFSHIVLRISTLVLALVGTFFTFQFFQLAFKNVKISLLLALFTVLNPVFFNLVFTFMTDVPFYAFFVLGLYGFYRYLEKGDVRMYLVGFIAIFIAVFIRQLGLVVPLALFLIAFWKKDWKLLLPFLVVGGAYWAYQMALPSFISDVGRGNEFNSLLVTNILEKPFLTLMDTSKRGVIFFIYFGLLFSPILLFLKWKKADFVIAFVALVSCGILYKANFLMPMNKNILYDLGLGPKTLYDTWVSKETAVGLLPIYLKFVLTFVGVFFGIKAGFYLILSLFDQREKQVFLATVLVGYLLLICSVDNFDRYYLPAFTLVLFQLSAHLSFEFSQYKTTISLVASVIIIGFSILGTKDYFGWQTARWQGISYLQNDLKIPKNKIDGGFEYNGSVNYNPDDFYNNVENLWVPDDTYRVCFEPIPNYSVIKEVEYTEWLKFGKKSTIKVLKKSE